MSGIYFHIPFCKQACNYCNFHFSTSLKQKDEMIAALTKEITFAQSQFAIEGAVETIYFGGGTPSLLSNDEISKLIDAVNKIYNVSTDAEITLEANPDDVNHDKLREWKRAGINRLSIGIQSFKEEDLHWMNRVHNAGQAFHCIMSVKDAGFINYSIDLIYGTPTLEDNDWKKNVDIALAMQVPHLSCYALTVEPATALHKMIAKNRKSEVDPEKQAKHFVMLMNWMKTSGYEHYEISNFALPGYRSRHNSSYWQGKSYIGIGPSAHSYFNNIRRWNVSNNALYIKSLQNNLIPYQEEYLSVTQRLNEYIMTSLRTIEGIDLDFVKDKFGEKISCTLQQASLKFQQNEKLKLTDQKLVLTTNGKLFADGIAADLFFTNN